MVTANPNAALINPRPWVTSPAAASDLRLHYRGARCGTSWVHEIYHVCQTRRQQNLADGEIRNWYPLPAQIQRHVLGGSSGKTGCERQERERPTHERRNHEMAYLLREIHHDGLADWQAHVGHAGQKPARGHRHDGVRGEGQAQAEHEGQRQGAAQDRAPSDDIAGAAQGRDGDELEDAGYEGQPLKTLHVCLCRQLFPWGDAVSQNRVY